MLLDRLLRRLITAGRLTVVDADGRTHGFGPGVGAPEVTVRLTDRALHYKLFLNPELYAGEAYMDGTLTIEDGSLEEFLGLCSINMAHAEARGGGRFGRLVGPLVRRLTQHNAIGRAQRNVAHHYDLSGTLYDLFLDRDRQYSCAYFVSPNNTLDQAQAAKSRHIAAKLLIEPGMRVLDIGSGWGGLALYLARECGADVTGVTLSREQHAIAERRAAEQGLAERVRFQFRDYREVEGRFDRIVSVGMFEHVGTAYYGRFFTKVRDLLADDGVALLHSIGRADGPSVTNPWIRKYIFPGGYIPALSEVLPPVEDARLYVTDIEILRLHYAETLKAWLRRFRDNRERVAALYDERFCRMWEFYLAACESAFRHWGQMVFQMQLAKRVETVPLTRDYIPEWEQAHALGPAA